MKITTDSSGLGGELVERGAETLADAYLFLHDVRVAHASFLVQRSDRLRRLEARSRLVMGSLGAARRFLQGPAASGNPSAGSSPGLASGETERPPAIARTSSVSRKEDREDLPLAVGRDEPDQELGEMLTRARDELEQARIDLELWGDEQERAFAEAFGRAESVVLERVQAYMNHHSPPVRVEVARVSGGSCVVHLLRPSNDDAVLLCAILAGRPPTRIDYLLDDSVEEVGGPVHLATREEGIDPIAISSGGADVEDSFVRDLARRLLPIRAHIPVLLPNQDWPRLRLRARGPVLELEARGEGEEYRHMVEPERAEEFAGFLLSCKARGLIQLDIDLP